MDDRRKSASAESCPLRAHYFCCAGTAGVAGFAGALVCEDLYPCNADPVPVLRDATTDKVMEVTIKMMAHQVVALVRMVAAPRGPNAVWLPWPPKAAAMSPLCALCSRTTIIKNRQTNTCRIVIRMIIRLGKPSG